MKINNVVEFHSFIRGAGLINLSPETKAVAFCLEAYSRMCPCDPPQARVDKLGQCKQFYVSFLSSASKHRNILLAKTDGTLVLCNDGQHVITLTR